MFFFFNDTAPTEIYTLSLHDALPICPRPHGRARDGGRQADGLGVLEVGVDGGDDDARLDRDQVDADERDADPRVDDDALVQHAVEHVNQAGSAGCPLNSHWVGSSLPRMYETGVLGSGF